MQAILVFIFIQFRLQIIRFQTLFFPRTICISFKRTSSYCEQTVYKRLSAVIIIVRLDERHPKGVVEITEDKLQQKITKKMLISYVFFI